MNIGEAVGGTYHGMQMRSENYFMRMPHEDDCKVGYIEDWERIFFPEPSKSHEYEFINGFWMYKGLVT